MAKPLARVRVDEARVSKGKEKKDWRGGAPEENKSRKEKDEEDWICYARV